MKRTWGVGLVVASLMTAGGAVWAMSSSSSQRVAGPQCFGQVATVVGTGDDDTLVGTPGPDVIVGLGGNDAIDGGAGDDVLCGGAGTDELAGGEGDDKVYGQRDGLAPPFEGETSVVGDTVSGGPGDDLLDPGDDLETQGESSRPDRFSYATSGAGVTVDAVAGTATGEGSDTLVVPTGGTWLIGSEQADVLTGGPYGDIVIGGGGADILRGRGGGDSLYDDESVPAPAHAANDQLFGGSGRDDLVAGYGDDSVVGGGGPDIIEDSFGRPDIHGGARDDDIGATLLLADQTQVVDGGLGNDRLSFNVGTTTDLGGLVGDGVVDMVNQRVQGTVDSVTFLGTLIGVEEMSLPRGKWTFRGSDADEMVMGFTTRDSRLTARMGAGSDTVYDGFGADDLAGGPGRDTVYLYARGGTDTCVGFEVFPEGRCER